MLKKGPFRLRSQRYLNHIRGQSCLTCGSPGEAHHLQFAQPRALGKKTGDQYCVPLCHLCHMTLHNQGVPERTWWAMRGIQPLVWAENEYNQWVKENGELPDQCDEQSG